MAVSRVTTPICRCRRVPANESFDTADKLGLWSGMRQLPPLAAVRVFEAAARHLNFTAAAGELGMTQAAVSYQIRALEERLGTALFLRSKGRVTLSDAGRRVAPLVTGAFDALDGAFAALRSDAAQVLTISSSATFAANWLAPRLGSFQLAQPDIAVRLHSSNAIVDFAREEVDVGIRSVSVPGPNLHADPLFTAEVTPMASPGFLASHPMRAPADLLAVPHLSPGDDWWPLWFAAVGLAPDPQRAGLRLDSQAIEGAAAIAGQGIAILSLQMWTRELADGRLVAPFTEVASTGAGFWLVCPEDRRNVPKIKAFRAWLLAEVASRA